MNNYRIINDKKYDIDDAILLFETNWGNTKYYWSEVGYFYTHTHPKEIGIQFRLCDKDEIKKGYGGASHVYTPYEEMFQ